jgi:hypothetical protein
MKDLLSWLGRKGRYSRGQILGPLMLRSAHPHMLLSFASADVICGQLGIVREIKRFGAIMGAADSGGQDEERRI